MVPSHLWRGTSKVLEVFGGGGRRGGYLGEVNGDGKKSKGEGMAK